MGLTKATLKNLDSNATINCLFNPTEYTVAKTNSWQPKKNVGKNVPQLDFTGGGGSTLSMQLFFDVNEDGSQADVRTHTNKLFQLMLFNESQDKPKKNKKTQRARPPLCLFQWGPNWTFTAVITSLSVRFTLFREDGTPVRATADVKFQEAADDHEKGGTNPTSHGEPGRKLREVQPHDTLARISYDEYGEPGLWRLIAEENQLDDPLHLWPGQILSIPPVSE